MKSTNQDVIARMNHAAEKAFAANVYHTIKISESCLPVIFLMILKGVMIEASKALFHFIRSEVRGFDIIFTLTLLVGISDPDIDTGIGITNPDKHSMNCVSMV